MTDNIYTNKLIESTVYISICSDFVAFTKRNAYALTESQPKGSHTRSDNRKQSLESQVNLCMYGGHCPAKSG